MNENPNNQQGNNDLDSLLKEFQSLSNTPKQPTPVESNPTVSNTQSMPGVMPAQPSVASQPNVAPQPVVEQPSVPTSVSPTPQVVPASTQAAPVGPTPVQPSVAPQPAVEQPSLQTVQPGGVVTQSTPTVVAPQNSAVASNSMATPQPIETLEVPMQSEKEEQSGNDGLNKKGKGKSNFTFIIILFVIIAVFILLIPKINEMMHKKPGKENPNVENTASPVPTKTPVVEKTVTCTEPEVASNEKQKVQKVYKLYYANDKVTKLEYTYKNMYAQTVDPTTDTSYLSAQSTCNRLNSDYANITGYTVTCTEKGNAFDVVYAYDLKDFTNPTQITINGQTQTLSSIVNYGDDIETVKGTLTANGATCQ